MVVVALLVAGGGEIEDPSEVERDELEALRVENEQLRGALDSRIVIEQAKGVLAERLDMTVEDAFVLLRYSARSAHMPIHELARATGAGQPTPLPIVVGLARSQRWRAAAQRERAEAHRDKAANERERIAEIAAKLRHYLG